MLPLGLSMLWESVEPEVALKERFGFDSFEAATGWASAALDETWGITVSECPRLVISGYNTILWVRSDHGSLVVKWSRARRWFASLDASTRLLRALADQGIPVASPLATTDGLDRIVLDGPTCALSTTVLPELAGDWLDVSDDAAVRSAGACLARLHQALGTIQDDVVQPDATRPEESPKSTPTASLTQRIEAWLADDDPGLAPAASSRLRDLLPSAQELDDAPQLVHNDFRAANILTRGSEVVGVLDLDEVGLAHRVSDLARASVYLGTLFTAWAPTSGDVRRSLRAGYESVRPLSPAEAHWLEILLLWHGLLAIPGENDPAGWAAAV